MRQISIGRLKGRFVVSWKSDDGRRKRFRLEALSRKEAEAEAIDVYRRETITTSGETVEALWKLYLNEREGRAIVKSMSSTVKAMMPFFGALRPDQITVEHCRDYDARRRLAGIKQGTVWTELGHLRIVVNWAVKKGLIERAPFIELPQKPAPRERHLTRAEAGALIRAEAQPHIILAIRLMLSTAARVGAILDLTWDRVDLERRVINLRTEGTGPRKGRAVVPINDTLLAALVEAKGQGMTDHVIEWNGKPVQSIRKGFGVAVRSVGLKDVTIHTLRHSAAVMMVEAGTSMDEVAQYLGHSNSSITFKTYARFSPSHLRAASRVLDF
ncbi:site-specific integrase [Paracoccus liaowanqingii]|uniref:Site-specific integrase n=1 Tax=Paracoccus liaowanqingii TaxID=2560053 RepID=A0A4P7HKD3_9RHOB|nr:site-specific integrase [Paracoccus liaowanqingii]QBX34624.1 site-specific integrase [Paracoccus liaowanqingii]